MLSHLRDRCCILLWGYLSLREREKTQEEQSQQELPAPLGVRSCLPPQGYPPPPLRGLGGPQGVPHLGTSLAIAGSCFVPSPPWAGDKQRRAFPRISLLSKLLWYGIYFAGLMHCAFFSLANSSKCTQITLLLSAQVQTTLRVSS